MYTQQHLIKASLRSPPRGAAAAVAGSFTLHFGMNSLLQQLLQQLLGHSQHTPLCSPIAGAATAAALTL